MHGHFYKGCNFCNFRFTFSQTNPLLFREDCFHKGQIHFDRIISPESVSILINIKCNNYSGMITIEKLEQVDGAPSQKK